MIAEFLFFRFVEYISIMKYFPSVLMDNLLVSSISSLMFLVIAISLRSRQPVFAKPAGAPRHRVKSQATSDDSIIMLASVFVSTYITYQYVVHGGKFINFTIGAIIFVFFGQIYNTFTKVQYSGFELKSLAQAIAKLVISTAALTTAAVLLASSAAYWDQLPPWITSLNYAEFLGSLFRWFFESHDWSLFVMQQAGGVAIRLVIFLISIATVAYHICVRFPGFCSNNPRLYRNLHAFDSALNYFFLFILSFASNSLLKGTFGRDLETLSQMIARFFFEA